MGMMKKKKIGIIIAFSAAFIVLTSLIVVIILSARQLSYKNKVTLGEKYLSNSDYDNAVLSYEAAIRINSKKEDAYLGLSRVYESQGDSLVSAGDIDGAVRCYKKARNIIMDCKGYESSEILSSQLERISESIKDASNSEKTVAQSENESPEIREPETSEIVQEEVIIPSKDIYKEFFYSQFSDADMVCLADITHDGDDDMIVVHRDDANGYGQYAGYVFTIQDGNVKKIYERFGDESHAGGFFNWFLIKNGNNSFLGEEVHGMWQGMGQLSFITYHITPDGEYVEDNSIICPESSADEDSMGYITDEALDRYYTKVGNALGNGLEIIDCYDPNSGMEKAETNPQKVFQ